MVCVQMWTNAASLTEVAVVSSQSVPTHLAATRVVVSLVLLGTASTAKVCTPCNAVTSGVF